MNHGFGNLDKAINLLGDDRSEFRDFVNQNVKFNPHIMFITKPKAEMVVKRVEKFREKSAGKALYQRPAPDGSRPGTYYANLYSMKMMPIYQMEALAYHEGIPGHHMQLAIAQELEDVIPELIIKSEAIGKTQKYLQENYPDTDYDTKLSVDYSRLTVVLINAIKEQQEEIENMKERLEYLESNV